MKNYGIVVMLIWCMAQTLVKAQSNAPLGGTIPQESVYVHYTESTLFSGEKLWYKFYGLNKATKKLTEISKIGYVALVASNGEVVFEHKLQLHLGAGYGDFFVPASLPTGPYKLLGYTEWMRNFGADRFFQADIFIINPYQTLPEAYVAKTVDSVQPVVLSRNNVTQESNDSPFVNVSLDKTVAEKRERVEVAIEGTNVLVEGGTYSISVRLKDTVSFGGPSSPELFFRNMNQTQQRVTGTNSKTLYFPEIRGEVISGTILDKGSQTPVENQKITLSLPGEDYQLKVATSDGNGRFSFILDKAYNSTQAFLQLLSGDKDQYEINLDAKQRKYAELNFSEFGIGPEMEKAILERSVHNQVENAYGEIRMDSVIQFKPNVPFYRNLPIVYDLDAYTRFNTLAETIIEVTDHLSIKTFEDGHRVFEVRPNVGLPNDNLTAMVFVDGLFLKNHEDFMGYSAKKVKSISFSRDEVMLGSQIFQGVLHFKTLDGNFYREFYSDEMENVALFRPEVQKVYFTQAYKGNGDQNRVPDFRHQLLWEPTLDLSEEKKELVFYTSDVAGTYELVLEGFTSNGNPVSVKRSIIVR